MLAYASQHPIGRRQPLRTLARMARWQIRSRLDAGPHSMDWIEGRTLVARRGMSGATGEIYYGLRECADMAFMLHLLRPGDLFLDIGANVGTWTVLGAGVCRARVIAFEPDPEALDDLRRNIAANAIAALVTVHDVALSGGEGPVAFTVGRGAMNRVATGADGRHRTVSAKRLDGMAIAADPVFIKLDVEGHEAAVLAGAADTLARPGLLAVQTEAFDAPIGATLVAHGFSRHYYDPFARRLTQTPIANDAHNALFVRDAKAVRARLTAAPAIDIFGTML